jgi:hypothetical protein
MNGRPWLQSHTETLLQMNAKGYTDAEIATITGHNRRTVERRRNALGLPHSKWLEGWVRARRVPLACLKAEREECSN